MPYLELLSLHEFQELFPTHLTVAQDLAEQPWPDGFPGVYQDHGAPAVRVAKKMVAATDANSNETRAGKDRYQFITGEAWISTHAAMTTR